MAAIRQTILSWRGLVAVSLFLNGFLLAYLASQYFMRPRFIMGAVPPPAMVARVADMLPEADARILWDAYHRSEAKMSSAQKDYREVLMSTAAILRQPAIDEAALKQAVLEARDKRQVVGDMMIEVFLDAFPKMSLAGRELMVEKSLH